MEADGKGLREELVEYDVEVQLMTGLIIRVVILGVVDVADIEGKVAPCLRIQISEREIGVEAPVVEAVVDQVVDVVIACWRNDELRE